MWHGFDRFLGEIFGHIAQTRLEKDIAFFFQVAPFPNDCALVGIIVRVSPSLSIYLNPQAPQGEL